MLQAAERLCRSSIPFISEPVSLADFFLKGLNSFDWSNRTGLIDKNGDAEMWRRLCQHDNRKIVRVARWGHRNFDLNPPDSYYWADNYPKDADVMDQNGKVTKGIQADNSFPICAELLPATAEEAAAHLAKNPVGGANGSPMPLCPPQWLADPKSKLEVVLEDRAQPKYIGISQWSARGAINAGLAVMLYLRSIVDGKTPTPQYDQCQELQTAVASGK